MREHFPEFDGSKLDWIIIGDIDSIRFDKLEGLVDRHINSEELLVEINRKLGDFLPKAKAFDFLAPYVGKTEIKITNREFSGFVLVAINGVAAGWVAASRETDEKIQ